MLYIVPVSCGLFLFFFLTTAILSPTVLVARENRFPICCTLIVLISLLILEGSRYAAICLWS